MKFLCLRQVEGKHLKEFNANPLWGPPGIYTKKTSSKALNRNTKRKKFLEHMRKLWKSTPSFVYCEIVIIINILN